jgi:hypothetical protein
MKFHVLLPVRDEADIIGQCLQQLLRWADALYVFDSGSTDQTWEIVSEFASKENRIKLLGKDRVFFSDKSVRAWIFQAARRHMRDGDWFLRADADEFHHVPPPEFIKTCVGKHETVVYHQYYDFRLTESEVNAWKEGSGALDDRSRPIEERRRFYTISDYTEPRLCRYRASMRWPSNVSFPFNAGFVAQARLPIRHYPHRDPLQMDRRCRVRALMMQDPLNASARHWAISDWREHVAPDRWIALNYWRPGTDLPEFKFRNHLASPGKRALQCVVHRCFVRMLDRFRPDDTVCSYPRRIFTENTPSRAASTAAVC